MATQTELVQQAIDAVEAGQYVDFDAVRTALQAAGDQMQAMATDPDPEAVPWRREAAVELASMTTPLLAALDVLEQRGADAGQVALWQAHAFGEVGPWR